MRPTEIEAVEWAALHHAYGPAANMPDLWRRFLAEGDAEGELANTVCHQGTVYPATVALVPFLIDLAKSNGPRSADALSILGEIVRSSGGVAEGRHRLAAHPVMNPFTGQPHVTAPPNPDELAAERQWVATMKRDIANEIEAWLASAKSADPRVRYAAVYLLIHIAHKLGDVRAEAALHDALDGLSAQEQRAMEWMFDDEAAAQAENRVGRPWWKRW